MRLPLLAAALRSTVALAGPQVVTPGKPAKAVISTEPAAPAESKKDAGP